MGEQGVDRGELVPEGGHGMVAQPHTTERDYSVHGMGASHPSALFERVVLILTSLTSWPPT